MVSPPLPEWMLCIGLKAYIWVPTWMERNFPMEPPWWRRASNDNTLGDVNNER